jgi:hypothetical protein
VQGNFERPRDLNVFQNIPVRTLLTCAGEVHRQLLLSQDRRPLQLPDVLLSHLRLAVAPLTAPGPTAVPAAAAAAVEAAASIEGDIEGGQVGVRRKRAVGE